MKNLSQIRIGLLMTALALSLGSVAQTISGVINAYYRVTAINSSTNGVTVSNSAGLAPGTRVLIIQMKGATMNTDNASTFGDITAISQAGNYEYNIVCAVAGNDILFRHELMNSYNTLGDVQLVTVPQYNIVTVTDTLKAAPWNSAAGTGGVLVLDADTLYHNSGITATGNGFAGAPFVNFPTPTYDCSWAVTVNAYSLPLAPVPNQYYSGGPKGEGISNFISNAEYGKGKQANGGGGGNNHNTGGAGGGNFGSGGNGGARSNETFFLCHGTHPGIGGLSVAPFGYTSGNNRVFMGGGGGSAHQNNGKGTPGGNGGGIILINANVLVGSGSEITADGLASVNMTNTDPYTAEGDGGGGAGAGGVIVLNVNEYLGALDASATGGRGSDASRNVSDCTGPGGGGGGGVVWMKGAALSPNVNAIVTGGSNGVISAFTTSPCGGQSNGATAGNNGTAIAGYVRPAFGNFICAPLSTSQLDYFRARVLDNSVVVTWQMNNTTGMKSYEVERSFDLVSYVKVDARNNDGTSKFTSVDNLNFNGTIRYRLKMIFENGTSVYSTVVPVTRIVNNGFTEMRLMPNPVRDQLTVTAFISSPAKMQLSIFNSSGQLLYKKQYFHFQGYLKTPIPTSTLAPGIYWLMVEGNGSRERKKFIKK